MSYYQALSYDLKEELEYYIAANEIMIFKINGRSCCYPCGADGILKIRQINLELRFLPYRLTRFLAFIENNPNHVNAITDFSEDYDRFDNLYHCNQYVLCYSNKRITIFTFKYIKDSIPRQVDYRKIKREFQLNKGESYILLKKLQCLLYDLELRNIKQTY